MMKQKNSEYEIVCTEKRLVFKNTNFQTKTITQQNEKTHVNCDFND